MIPQLLGTGVPIDSFVFRDDAGDERTIVVRAAAAGSDQPSLGWMVVLTDETDVAERLRRTERRLAGYRFAALVIGELSRARDARQLLGKVCELAVEQGGFAAAWAIVRDRAGGFVDAGMVGLDPNARAVAEQLRVGAETAVSSLLMRVGEGEIVYENDAAADKYAAWPDVAHRSGIGSYAAFGLVENGQLLVAVSLFAREPGFFGPEEQDLVETLRDEIQFALERLELDRKRLDAEEALSQSEHAYRRFFEDNPLPMWIYDERTFEFLAVNDAAAAKYGYSRDQFMRMTIKDIRPAADVPFLVDHVGHTGAGFEDAGFWTHVDSEGREFPVHVVTHDTEWEGRAARLVLVQEIAQVR